MVGLGPTRGPKTGLGLRPKTDKSRGADGPELPWCGGFGLGERHYRNHNDYKKKQVLEEIGHMKGKQI